MTNKQLQRLEQKHRAKVAKHNCIAKIALDNKKDYVTPEDAKEARLDALECLGDISGFGVEDKGLFAFVAFEGK